MNTIRNMQIANLYFWTSTKMKQIKWNEPLYQEHKIIIVFIDFSCIWTFSIGFFRYYCDSFLCEVAPSIQGKKIICMIQKQLMFNGDTPSLFNNIKRDIAKENLIIF